MQIAPPRLNTVDQFSMFITFPLKWEYDPRLRRNIQLYIARDRQFAQLCNAQDLVGLEQFFKDLAFQDSPPKQEWEPFNRKQLALKHLTSYYDLTAYNAARKLSNIYQEIDGPEVFLVIRQILWNAEQFKQYFQTYKGYNNAQFSTYLQEILMNKAKDEISVGKYSQWRRLCHESNKRLREALELASYSSADITRFLFIRKNFKTVYMNNRVRSPMRRSGEKWPIPEAEDFEETAKLCNAERFLPRTSIEISGYSEELTAIHIKQWLRACTDALNTQKILENHIISLENRYQQAGYEPTAVTMHPTFGDSEVNIKQTDRDDRITTVFEHQLRQKKGKVQTIMEMNLGDRLWLVDSDKILLLYYGLEFTEVQIAARLELNQSSIHRRRSSYTKHLLTALNQMSQPESWVSTYISNWLHHHLGSPDRADKLQGALIQTIQEINEPNRLLLFLHYGQQLNPSQIGQQLNLTEAQINRQLNQIEQQLSQKMYKTLDRLSNEYIKRWLYQYYQTPVDCHLRENYRKLEPEVKKIMSWRYERQLNEREMMQEFNIEAEQIHDRLAEGICTLEESLVSWLSEYVDAIVQDNEHEAIANRVRNWLEKIGPNYLT